MIEPWKDWFELHETGLLYGLVLGWVLMTLALVRLWPTPSARPSTGPAHLEVSAGVDRYDVDRFRPAETWWIPPAWSEIPAPARAACSEGSVLPVDGGSFAVVEVTADTLRLQGRLLADAWVGVDAEGNVQVPMLIDALEPLLHYRTVQAERLPCTAATAARVLVSPSRDVPSVALAAVLRSVTLAGGQADVQAVEPAQLDQLNAGAPLQWTRDESVRLGHSFDLPAQAPRPTSTRAHTVSHPSGLFL
ncbi:MAG TPA: hypothetical protein DFR83_01375 [Deltaproteobacteria bacterium]|nr:hypothetical protein [Deltaproteobacteria bacterium]